MDWRALFDSNQPPIDIIDNIDKSTESGAQKRSRVDSVNVVNEPRHQASSDLVKAAHPLSSHAEQLIRAWLAQIGEMDPELIAEVMAKCRTDAAALDYFTARAEETPSVTQRPTTVTCTSCRHFQRIDHPHLGHCGGGEPEPIGGLWDTDPRSSSRWQPANEQQRG